MAKSKIGVVKLSDSYIVRKINLNELKIDHYEDGGYQRGLKANHKRIAGNLNKAAVGTLHVGNRGEEGMYLIDGQQRREALLLNNINEWDAIVLPSSGREYEAGIYAMLNGKDRKGLTKMELFQGQLAAKDPIALAVKRAVESVGWKIAANHGSGQGDPSSESSRIRCVGTLYRQCSLSGGEEMLTRSLSILDKGWPGQLERTHEAIVGGVCQLIRTFSDQIDEKILNDVMGVTTPRQILLNAMNKVTSHRGTEVCYYLVAMYNKKQRSKPKKLKLAIRNQDSTEDENVA